VVRKVIHKELMMRIALAQILQETNTFNPLPCTLDDFKAGGLFRGQEILERYQGIGEIGGLIKVARERPENVVLLPILRAASMSGGKLTTETIDYLRAELLSGLKDVHPIDGFFFSLHGASASETIDDVEGYLLDAVRDVVGEAIPLVVPLDHHANLTPQMVQAADMMVGYQEHPHDPYETGMRAANHLFNLINGEYKPTPGWQKIPMIAPVDLGLTAEWPMKAWFDLARNIESSPGILSASTFPVHPWLDVDALGWSTIVYTDGDAKLANKLAARLANKAWELREAFWNVNRISPKDLLSYIAQSEGGTFLISDASDSVLAGAPGDSTCLLRKLIEFNVPFPVLLPMVDPGVVQEAIKAGIGNEITVWVGGKRDNVFSTPVQVTGLVANISEDRLVTNIQFGGYDSGRVAVLEVENIILVVSELRGSGGIHPDMYRQLGLHPENAKMIVVKSIANFQYFRPLVTEVIMLDCQGMAGWDLREFPWREVPRPLYPLDDMHAWEAKY
jgi:microcystin degradation protein MlrC